MYVKVLKWRPKTVEIAIVTVQNGAELGALFNERNKAPVQGREIQIAQRQNSPSDYTLGNIFPRFSPSSCACVIGSRIPEGVMDGEFCL